MSTEPVGTDGGPVHELPLPPELVALLESLQPIRGSRHHKAADPTPQRALPWRPVEEVATSRVPRLRALRGQRELAVIADRTVSVLYLPDEELLDLPRKEALRRGATSLTARFDPAALWTPTAERITRRSPASGDSTSVNVRGHLVGVQRREHRVTRLAWAVRDTETPYDVEVWAGWPPREAVELLVGSEHP